MSAAALVPLDMLRTGELADVADVAGDPAWVCRMAELGLRPGCRVEMLQAGVPCLLRVAGCRLCLRTEDSAQILVRPVETSAGHYS
jgi:Fe2+ transport system protein FeoA